MSTNLNIQDYGDLFANGADGVLFKKENIVTKISNNVFELENDTKLDHKYIVPSLDITFVDNKLIEQMPYYEHGCLQGIMHKLNHKQIVDVLNQLTIAIEFLHQNNIQHRDIKPANILIESLNPIHIRLADFSRAKKNASSFSATTNLGTFKYMAPEAEHMMPNKRSDWYSVGATLADITSKGKCFNNSTYKNSDINYAAIPDEFRNIVNKLTLIDEEKRAGSKEIFKFIKNFQKQVKEEHKVTPKNIINKAITTGDRKIKKVPVTQGELNWITKRHVTKTINIIIALYINITIISVAYIICYHSLGWLIPIAILTLIISAFLIEYKYNRVDNYRTIHADIKNNIRNNNMHWD